MLSLILKDRGSNYHCKITDEDFDQAQNELVDMKEDHAAMTELKKMVVNVISQYAEHIDWFDVNALKNAKKEGLAKFLWLLARSYEIRLEKEGLLEKYGFHKDINSTKKEDEQFDKYFERREKIGFRFAYTYGDKPNNWTLVFSHGFQLARLVLGPFGFILGKIPYVALGFFIMWVSAAFFDWVILGIPYLTLKIASGLPGDYYDSDLLIGSYLLGNTTNAKDQIRSLVKNDSSNSDAYLAGLWGLFMREKLVEIVRKARKDEAVHQSSFVPASK